MLPVTISMRDSTESINSLKEMGVTEANLQLFPEDLSNIAITINNIINIGFKIVSVHTPFNIGWKGYCFEDWMNEPIIERSLYLVQELAIALDIKELPTVIHCRLTPAELYKVKPILPRVRQVLESVPRVHLCLENVPGLNENLPKRYSELITALPTVVKALQKELPKVSMCFDVCHASITCRMIEVLQGYGLHRNQPIPELHDFLRMSDGTIALVHLANCRNLGDGEDHGTAFTDPKELDIILKILNRYCPQATVVLEVSESDYAERPNVKATLKCYSEINNNK